MHTSQLFLWNHNGFYEITMASMKWLHYLVVLSSNVSMVTDHLLWLYLFYGMVLLLSYSWHARHWGQICWPITRSNFWRNRPRSYYMLARVHNNYGLLMLVHENCAAIFLSVNTRYARTKTLTHSLTHSHTDRQTLILLNSAQKPKCTSATV